MPRMVNAFDGNLAETATMLPVILSFTDAHQLPDVTVVAHEGTVPEANRIAIEAAGLSFILGAKIPMWPSSCWHGGTTNPARTSPIARCAPGPGRAGPSDRRRDQTIYYQTGLSIRRTVHGVDE
jgi:hypothetical protein